MLDHVVDGGRISSKRLDQQQLAAHALAFLATEVEAARQLVGWVGRVREDGSGGDLETRIAGAYVGELCRQLVGGVELGPCESISLNEMWLDSDDVRATLRQPQVVAIGERFASGDAVCKLAELAHDAGSYGSLGLGDETLDAVQAEFRKFTEREVAPIAQDVHRNDVLLPLELYGKMSDLGVFGLTIPEEFGGQGLGKVAMCVVTEELSRGYIGVGSLGTRAEIAAELIMGGGTDEQKRHWLPLLASGEVLPTAVFTEPNHGSDLAHIKSRAEKQPRWLMEGLWGQGRGSPTPPAPTS